MRITYRMSLPYGAMKRAGISVQGNANREVSALDFTHIIGQRICTVEASSQWLRLANQPFHNYKLIMDVDDLLDRVTPSNKSAWDYFDKPMLDRLHRNMEVADLITTTTDYLAYELSAWTDAPIAVLGNCVDGQIESIVRTPPEVFTVGWQGGSSHLEDIRYVKKAWSRFLRDTPDAKLHIIGVPEFALEFDKDVWDQCIVTSWMKTPIGLYQHMDMTVTAIPLKSSPFADAKSPLKCLEAQALGIPAVCSPAVYGDWVTDGVDGLIAKTPNDFPRLLRDLKNDVALRESLIKGGHEKARQHFIQDRHVDWIEALRSVM